MKIIRLLLAYSLSFLVIQTYTAYKTTASSQKCSINIESHWEDLENNKEKSQRFGGKWILAGTITFKKKCKDPIDLQEMHLQWHGNYLDQLQGSLFISKNLESFKPINENHIADSAWSKTTQTLVLKFNRSLRLSPITVFYLVLTIPEEQEQLLKGNFTIKPTYLPTPFQQTVQQDPLSINLDIARKFNTLNLDFSCASYYNYQHFIRQKKGS